MKKYILAAFALAAVLSGCVKDELTNGQDATIDVNAPVFYAGFADASSETKTYVNENGHLRWNSNDRLTIFVGKTLNTQYAFDGEDGDNAGGFNPIADGGGFVTANPLNANYAVYPYSSTTKISEEGVISLSLPSVQTYGEDSFGRGANTMIAVTQGTDDFYLPFKNVCGYLVVSLYGDATITSVSLEGNNEEKLAGAATVTPSFGGNPSLVMKDTATKTITVDCGEGVMLGTTKETATAFWFVVPQTTFSKGITITATSKDGESFQKATSKTITIERNKISTMAALEYEVSPHSGNINFADPAAKYACVAKYDTNGDGEVSIEEAEAATSFSGLFTDWKTVASFDEIKYFKNVHSISGLFNGCSRLVSITIPENITNLGTSAFSGCSSLTSVNLPSNITKIGNYTFENCSTLTSIEFSSVVTSIGNYAFDGCSSMTHINLPSSVKTLGDYSFRDCAKLVSLVLPANLSSIGKYAFFRCSSLNQIAIPDGVTSLGDYVFSGCSSLISANIPSGISSIPNNCFYDCGSLTSISIPSGISSVGSNAFYGVKLWKLELPSSVTALGNDCFGNDIACVILPATSPVYILSDSFGGVKGIFAPAGMIDMYKVMTNWPNYISRIHPLSSYREKDEFTIAILGAVDMGTSVKWAACNLGASKPEEYGGYYQWGGLQDVTDTSIFLGWSNCPYHTGLSSTTGWTKYMPDGWDSYWSGAGSPDNKKVLEPEDDAAHVLWGGNWRMSTREEFDELVNNCFWEETTYHGTRCSMVYSFETGNIIILPCAGYRFNDELYDEGGWYWSSSLNVSWPICAYELYIGEPSTDELYTKYRNYRDYALSIRPVSE